MPRCGNQTTHRTIIDLTHSDTETFDLEPQALFQQVLSEPTQRSRRRSLTARECLRADRMAFGENDAPSLSNTFAQNVSPSDEEIFDLTNEVTTQQANVRDVEARLFVPCQEGPTVTKEIVGRSIQHENESHEASRGLANGNDIENEPREYPVEQVQSDPSPIIISSSSESGDLSDDEFVLYGEKDIIDLTNLENEEEPKVVETMANGRPRRACAPKSFEGLVERKRRKRTKRAITVSAVTLTKEERALADKCRGDLVRRAVAAHHALWENRFVHNFSYNCGRINVGHARSALMRMGQFIGARPTVDKKHESGSLAKYVMMTPGKHLCSPTEQDIREVADILVDRSFKHSAQKKAEISIVVSETKTETKTKEKAKAKAKTKTKTKAKAKAKTKAKTKTKTKAKTKAKTKTKAKAKAKTQGKLGGGEVIRRSTAEENSKKNKEKTMKEKQRTERMEEVAQGVRRDEDAFRRLMPLQEEARRECAEQEPTFKRNHRATDSLMSNRDGMNKKEAQSHNIFQASKTGNNDDSNNRKRKIYSREDDVQSKEERRIAWEQKRQRRLEGMKIGNGNKGFALLAKMGWNEGQCLGARKNGISEPIVAEFRAGRRGLGTK